MKKTLILGVLALFVLVACATVTITPEGQNKTVTEADWQERQSFFLWGLVPASHEIDVVEVCPDGVRQMQAQSTFVDGLLGSVTLGIYTPRTARVWCQVVAP